MKNEKKILQFSYRKLLVVGSRERDYTYTAWSYDGFPFVISFTEKSAEFLICQIPILALCFQIP